MSGKRAFVGIKIILFFIGEKYPSTNNSA